MGLRRLAFVCLFLGLSAGVRAQDLPTLVADADGRLIYGADSRGDRVLDFSSAGYRGGGVVPPTPGATIRVTAPSGDATATVQAAIDTVAARSPGPDGLRGVVQLAAGRFEIEGQIRIEASGVVLRGSGAGDDGTVLIAMGTRRRSLIEVAGAGAARDDPPEVRHLIGARVPTGADTVTLDSVSGLLVGTVVSIRRDSTAEWIDRIGMNRFEGWRPETRLDWQPGSRDIVWTRRIIAIDGRRVTLDAPLSTALDPAFGGTTVAPEHFEGRLEQVGIENLRMVSPSDPARPMDEDHAWFAVSMDKVRDGWIRDVSARGFVSYVVNLGPDATRITVQDVDAAEPVSEIGGFRRRVFYSAGQQVLFNRCSSIDGSHDFVLGHTAAGPNVFLDCTAVDAHDDSGPIESWASGALFDNVIVRGGPLRLADRGTDGQGVGWAAANSVLWNCQATDVEASSPPDAYNLAIGCKGVVRGDGIVQRPGVEPARDIGRAEPAPPRSLYVAQLIERLGSAATLALEPTAYPMPAADTPIQTAEAVTAWSVAHAPGPSAGPLQIENGRFVIDGQNAFRSRIGFSWYLGQMPPSLAAATGPAITRFAPGRTGVGATDDLEAMVDALRPGDVFYHHYGLWYDRRRVDHNFWGSPDQRTGEVWGPLMELPWGRSGQGRAWDGLTKYDLTRFNPWFFERVSDFAELADRKGRVLYYNFYFQHWLLESRAHYVDFPWRPVNTIQATGLPQEVPAANVFYDVSDPVRRDLHQRYIFHSLDVLKDRTNVVYGIDREYTGPLAFVEFWLDTIAEWERLNNRKVFVALEIPKAETDAILADPVRGPMVSAMAIHDWVYRPDGSLFATVGGLDRATREQQDAVIPPPGGSEALGAQRRPLWETTPAMRYRAFREYADKAPGLVQLLPVDDFPALTVAVEAAVSGSGREGAVMTEEASSATMSAWAERTPSGARLIYSTDGVAVRWRPGESRRWTVRWIGASRVSTTLETGEAGALVAPDPTLAGQPWAAWITPDTIP